MFNYIFCKLLILIGDFLIYNIIRKFICLIWVSFSPKYLLSLTNPHTTFDSKAKFSLQYTNGRQQIIYSSIIWVDET